MVGEALLALSALFLVALPVSVTSSRPGNVFTVGDRVVLTVTGGSETGRRFRVLPYDGPAVKEGGIAGSTLDLGTLPTGYYTVEVADGDQTSRTPVVVTPRPRARRVDRLAVDAAHSWLLPPERFADGAELLRLAGFHWIRERLSWGEVEPERGKFVWGRYDAAVDAAHARGIHVYQIFHNSPAWSRADGNTARFPDDLRDVYRFAREAALHFKGKVEAWEVWNEADITGFSVDSPAEYAAFFKAAVLGFKAGDPSLPITQVSLALQSTRYHEALYRNGTADYMDVFNYHIYDAPANYPRRAQGHFDVMDAARVWGAPVWLTEAGIPLHETGGTLSEADRRKQAEFIPKSYVMSLASGTDRHHFFVFPHYLENGIEFGVMDAQMRPYPGYSALAAVTHLLGEARYLGRVQVEGISGAEVHRFDRGGGETVVAWAEGRTIQTGRSLRSPGCRVYNCVGAEQPEWDGAIGPSPIFIVGKSSGAAGSGALAQRDPSKIGKRGLRSDAVLRVRLPDCRVVKVAENHLVRAGAAERVEVQVYNFGPAARRIRTRLEAPAGWKLDQDEWSDEVSPLGRAVHETRLHVPPSARQFGHVLRASGSADGPARVAPVELDLALDPASMQASETRSLGLDAPNRWADNISGNGRMTHEADPEGGVRFHCTFSASGDKWAYPTVEFEPPADWRSYDAIEAEIAADRDDPETELRFQVVEPGGAAYHTETGYPAQSGWRRVVAPFAALEHGSFSAADPDGHLDLDRIALFRFGVNTRRTEVTIRIRNVRLLRWG